MSGNADPNEARVDGLVERAEKLAHEVGLALDGNRQDVVMTALAIAVAAFVRTAFTTKRARLDAVLTLKRVALTLLGVEHT